MYILRRTHKNIVLGWRDPLKEIELDLTLFYLLVTRWEHTHFQTGKDHTLHLKTKKAIMASLLLP